MQEQKRQKMNTGAMLRKFLPSECVDQILDVADYKNFETMEYWKEISSQPRKEKFPVGKLAEVGCWEGWIEGNKWNATYTIGLCHNCASPCSIYNQKIYIPVDRLGTHDWCSHQCMMEGESWAYAKYEKMHYKYAYD